MKTFYEKFSDKIDRTDNSVVLFEGEYKEIQLDASRSGYEKGVREAAEVVEKRISFVEAAEPAQINNQVDRRRIMEAVLSLLGKPKG